MSQKQTANFGSQVKDAANVEIHYAVWTRIGRTCVISISICLQRDVTRII